MHEAKVHTSWINPDPSTTRRPGVRRGVLDENRSGEFLADLRDFVRTVGRFGAVNSLAQTLVRCTAPGVPDTYQGTESWDFSLVDPDNRRPVDYDRLARQLQGLDERAGVDPRGLVRDLLADKADGRVKLYVASRALRFRRENPALFARGEYEPLEATGAKAEHAFAFARRDGDATAVAVVPRLVVGLTAGRPGDPVGGDVWEDTAIPAPAGCAGRAWRHVLTGQRVPPGETLALADVLADAPVALLAAE